jgi:hypothetical protein
MDAPYSTPNVTAAYFKGSADQGFAPGQWEYRMRLMHGIGVSIDHVLFRQRYFSCRNWPSMSNLRLSTYVNIRFFCLASSRADPDFPLNCALRPGDTG